MITDEDSEGGINPMIDFVARLGLSTEYQAAHDVASLWLVNHKTNRREELAQLEDIMISNNRNPYPIKWERSTFCNIWLTLCIWILTTDC